MHGGDDALRGLQPHYWRACGVCTVWTWWQPLNSTAPRLVLLPVHKSHQCRQDFVSMHDRLTVSGKSFKSRDSCLNRDRIVTTIRLGFDLKSVTIGFEAVTVWVTESQTTVLGKTEYRNCRAFAVAYGAQSLMNSCSMHSLRAYWLVM